MRTHAAVAPLLAGAALLCCLLPAAQAQAQPFANVFSNFLARNGNSNNNNNINDLKPFGEQQSQGNNGFGQGNNGFGQGWGGFNPANGINAIALSNPLQNSPFALFGNQQWGNNNQLGNQQWGNNNQLGNLFNNNEQLKDFQNQMAQLWGGQPFGNNFNNNNNNNQQLQKEEQLKQLQEALKGDPSVAGVVAPSLLLASSILFTVSNSLATAATSVGVASALITNAVGWTKWLNEAETFFLKLKSDGVGGTRGLLADTTDAANGTDYRAALLQQLTLGNDFLTAWGKQVKDARSALQGGPFQAFIQKQLSALGTARKALTAVGNHPLGSALGIQGVGLNFNALGGALGKFLPTGGVGSGALADGISKTLSNILKG